MATEAKVCAACGKEITGSAVNTGDTFFHPECFVCSKCKGNIAGSFTKSSEGLPVCQACTPKHTCARCEKDIKGKVLTAGDDKFHPECFACYDCKAALTEYFKTNGKMLCRQCITAMKTASGGVVLSQACCRCGKMIVGEGITGAKADDHFHKECFTCSTCSTPLDEFVMHGDRYLCAACGKKELGPDGGSPTTRCCACGEPTGAGDIHLMDGSSLHWACFKCTGCGKTESESDKTVMLLLRSRVQKVKEKAYLCDPCAQKQSPVVPETKVEVKTVVPQLPLGFYVMKEIKGSSSFLAKALHLREDFSCTIDCTSATGDVSSTWKIAGSYTEDITAGAGSVTVSVKSHSGAADGPKAGQQIKFHVSKPEPRAPQALVSDDLSYIHQHGVPESDVRAMLVPPTKAPAPPPIPTAGQRPSTAGLEEIGQSATTGSAGVMERKSVDTMGYSIVKSVEEEKAPAKPLPAVTPDGFFTLAQLRDPEYWKDKGVDPAKREAWLADDAFEAVFGMSKASFEEMPMWKRNKAKKEHGLF